MLRNEQSKKNDGETILVEIPAKKTKRYFPLSWGLASFGLLVVFAIITMIQFNRVNSEAIMKVEVDAYQSDIAAYESQVRIHEDCVISIETRETYLNVFAGITDVLNTTADLPIALFPLSEDALAYQEYLSATIDERITVPVEEGLPPKNIEDCPPKPTDRPVDPRED